MAHRLGVDVGGTFTDLLLVHDETGNLHRVKTPSTPSDPSEGVLVGVRRICEESGVAPQELRYVMHGTTVATNAVLEAKGARVGLVTTKGFKQILHLARSQTPGPLAGWIIMQKPDPPASLADTREVTERMDARGGTVTAVDEGGPEADARSLAQPDLRRPLGSVGRRRRCALRGAERGLRRHPHLRHGRHVDGRLALPERTADDRARDLDLALPPARAVRERAHDR